jgi:hypothetical protein
MPQPPEAELHPTMILPTHKSRIPLDIVRDATIEYDHYQWHNYGGAGQGGGAEVRNLSNQVYDLQDKNRELEFRCELLIDMVRVRGGWFVVIMFGNVMSS